jgi:FtsP/CotA-like multicopper oxidase with cupredoxin domain
MRRLGLVARIVLISIGVALALATTVIVVAVVYTATEATTYPNSSVAFERPLRIPELLKPTRTGSSKQFDLTVQSGRVEFTPGKSAATLGFNGAFLGPTIRASVGDNVRFRIRNTLDEAITVHWHGMDLPAAMDGGPHQQVQGGDSWEPSWTILNPASTLWYHSHQAAMTGEQVYRGLAGLFLIEDAAATVNLPHDYGVDDVPLIVQDRRFDADGQFVYDPAHQSFLSPGVLGETILVNGTIGPYLEVPAKLIRLRLLNGSNARRYRFAFADRRKFLQIASDGGLLGAPVEMTSLLLAPAERAEVLVDLRGDTAPLRLISLAITDPMDPVSNLMQAILVPGNDENQQFEILELRPVAGDYEGAEVPLLLEAVERLRESDVTVTREFVLEQDGRAINGRPVDHARVDQVVRRGDTEIWVVRNFSSSYHPFHVHGVQFQLLDRNGLTPAANELGWKDTVNVPTTQTVRLIMRFSTHADPRHPYMFHCHILEHEDMGMMGQFVVVENLGDEVSLAGPPADGLSTVHSGH